jgi:hypothetical protein
MSLSLYEMALPKVSTKRPFKLDIRETAIDRRDDVIQLSRVGKGIEYRFCKIFAQWCNRMSG